MLVDPELTEDEEMILPFNSVPLFGIIMYFGAMVDLDAEVWALCDGTQGTPNLVNQFVRGGDGTSNGVVGGTADAVVISHTHTGPSHTHTIASHVHTGAVHTHTGPSHTHTGPSHYHTGGAHTHTSAAHSHTASHSHTGHSTYEYVYSLRTMYTTGLNQVELDAPMGWSGWTFTGNGLGGGGQSGIGLAVAGTNAIVVDWVTLSTASVTPAATGSTTPGNGGYGGTGATGPSGTQATGAATAASTGGIALTTAAEGTGATGSAGVAGTDLNLPPFTTLVYIMRIK